MLKCRGINTAIDDFEGRARWGIDLVDGSRQDAHGHGTQVAGNYLVLSQHEHSLSYYCYMDIMLKCCTDASTCYLTHTYVPAYTPPATQSLDAGIVMSRTYGVAKKATAVAVRVLNEDNEGSLK